MDLGYNLCNAITEYEFAACILKCFRPSLVDQTYSFFVTKGLQWSIETERPLTNRFVNFGAKNEDIYGIFHCHDDCYLRWRRVLIFRKIWNDISISKICFELLFI